MWTLLAGCAAMDAEPPVLEVEVVAKAQRGSAPIQVRVSDVSPGVETLTLWVDGGDPEPLAVPDSGALTHALPLADLADGAHTVRVVATDASWRHNEAGVEVTVTVDQTPPVIEVAQSALTPAQGKTFAVWVRSDEPLIEPVATFAERTLPMFAVDGAWRALFGVATRHEPGPAPVVIQARDATGNEVRHEVSAPVAATDFAVGGFIRLSAKQKEARKDSEAIAKMRAERDGAYAVDAPKQRWTGPFALPVRGGRRTSPFGKYRTYSDGRRSYHSGLDLAKAKHEPLYAGAPGTVVIAHEQAIMGRVVIVDHGHGVTTSYNHMERIDVTAGQEVAQGDPLGTMGSTGQSTGPHLHWGLVVGREAIDPVQWLTEDFSTAPFDALGNPEHENGGFEQVPPRE